MVRGREPGTDDAATQALTEPSVVVRIGAMGETGVRVIDDARRVPGKRRW